MPESRLVVVPTGKIMNRSQLIKELKAHNQIPCHSLMGLKIKTESLRKMLVSTQSLSLYEVTLQELKQAEEVDPTSHNATDLLSWLSTKGIIH